MSGRRLETGGTWIDRSLPITFTLDGRAIHGFAGDTVASALLASGERGGFVSPIAGRPRGVFSAGVEEPNAFVEIADPWFEPIRPATMVNIVDDLQVISRAGVGVLPHEPREPRPATHLHRHVETLVIGALRDRPHTTHFSVAEAVDAAAKIGAARTYFTHISHDLGHAATCARLPRGVELAYDGQELVID